VCSLPSPSILQPAEQEAVANYAASPRYLLPPALPKGFAGAPGTVGAAKAVGLEGVARKGVGAATSKGRSASTTIRGVLGSTTGRAATRGLIVVVAG